jgi:hypothetical protein
VNVLATLSPLLTAALLALFGAIVGAIANGRVRDREARELRNQERVGLLILLDHEIKDNHSLLNSFKERPTILYSQSVGGLQTASWDNAKVRLAQLLAREHIERLASYYSQIYVLKITVAADTTMESSTEDGVSVLSNLAGWLSLIPRSAFQDRLFRSAATRAQERTGSSDRPERDSVRADEEARQRTASKSSREKRRERHMQHVNEAIELGRDSRSEGQKYL